MADYTTYKSYDLEEPFVVTLQGEVTTCQGAGSTTPMPGYTTATGEVKVTEVAYKDGTYYWKITKTYPDPSDPDSNIVKSAWIDYGDAKEKTKNGTLDDLFIGSDGQVNTTELNKYQLQMLSDDAQKKFFENVEPPSESSYDQGERIEARRTSEGWDTLDYASISENIGNYELYTYMPGNDLALMDTYVVKMIRTFGLPPQWTAYVDPRVSFGNYAVGRRFTETIMASPTILSLCPGKIKPSVGFGDVVSDLATADVGQAVEDINSALSSKLTDPFWKFEEMWSNKLIGESASGGYIDCCNTLCSFAAICLSVRSSPDGEEGGEFNLGNKIPPWGGLPYSNIQVQDFLSPSDEQTYLTYNNGTGIISSVADLISRFRSNLTKLDLHYVHFNANGGMSVEDSFNTETRQSSIEQVINGGISNTIKDIHFMTDGVIGGEVESDLNALRDLAISSFGGGIGNLFTAAMEILKGGYISFPQVIDNCTWGRSFKFSVKFISVYGDVESRFLNVIMPYLCLAAFFLPKQLKNKIDMFTYPPVVRAFARGVYACDCGVLSDISVKRGGEDDTGWTASGQPMEIDVSFSITSLHSRLMQSDSRFWFLKNTGMQMYIGTLCGIDMTVTQEELIKMTTNALINGDAFWADIRRQTGYGLLKAIGSNVITSVGINIVNMGTI